MVSEMDDSTDEDDRGQFDGKKINNDKLPTDYTDGISRSNIAEDDDDVLSLYAQSDYELETDYDRKKGACSQTGPDAPREDCDSSEGFQHDAKAEPESVREPAMQSQKKNKDDMQARRKQRSRNSNRSMRGRMRHSKHGREPRHAYVGGGGDVRRLGSGDSRFMNKNLNYEAPSNYRNPLPFMSSTYRAQKRGILGDAPLIKGRSSSMCQNRKPYLGEDQYPSMEQHPDLAASDSGVDKRKMMLRNEKAWHHSSLRNRYDETGRPSTSFSGANGSGRSSILGDGALYQQRMQSRGKPPNPGHTKEAYLSKGLVGSDVRESDDLSNRKDQALLTGSADSALRDHKTNSHKEHLIKSGQKGGNFSKSVSEKSFIESDQSPRNSGPYPSNQQDIISKDDESKAFGRSPRGMSGNDTLSYQSHASKPDVFSSYQNKHLLPIPDIEIHSAENRVSSNKSTLLPTPEAGVSEESLPPTKKSRVTLLPTPKPDSQGQWSVKSESDASEETTISKNCDEDSKKITLSVDLFEQSCKSEKISQIMKRSPEKTATVAPLPPVTVTMSVPPYSSDIADENESQQLDYLQTMVTPPIEVPHIIDAPPRPPNPGPTNVLSSNSNSPAASRPSSRSGRFGYELNRAATPDVPPRPVNPPPPVSAPSPASTPEGMPPRPQNPGPPLDISLSAMSRPSLSVTPNHSNHSGICFEDNSVPGLLPLPAHSKLIAQGAQSSHGTEPSPAHTSVTRVGLIQPPSGMRESSVSKPSVLCTSTSYNILSTTDASVKTLLSMSEKNSTEKQLGLDDEKRHVFVPEYATLPRGSVQSAVMDLSKPALVSFSSSSLVQGPKTDKPSSTSEEAINATLSVADSVSSQSKPSVSVSASLSFSTKVVNSSYPVQPSYLTSSTRTSSKAALLPLPIPESDKQDADAIKTKTGDIPEPKPSDFSEDTSLSESSLKENIISCLRNRQYSEGLTALKDAIAKMPRKFGDGEVYEVIEFFGQNDVFEHVVSAARLVNSPDERLLQFLAHVTEQAPASFKEKEDELWLIFNQVLSANASSSALDAFIRCFSAVGNLNKVWTALMLYGNSTKLPASTLEICLQGLASGQDDKHLRNGVLFLCSLPHHTKCVLDVDVINGLWLRCAEKGLADAANQVDQLRRLFPQTSENNARVSSKVRTLLMEMIVSNRLDSLSSFVNAIGQQYCQQYIDYFMAGFLVVEDPVGKIAIFLKEMRQRNGRSPASRVHEVFSASLCVRIMRHLSSRQAWPEAFELWRLVGELGIPCERAAALENESQTSIALLSLEICVRHGHYEAAVSVLSESLVLGQPWNDVAQVRLRVCLLQEIFQQTIENRLDFAAVAFKALLSTKDTDQSIIPDYAMIVDLMTVYNDFIVGACHSGDLATLTSALDLIAIAHQKQLLVKPTVLRYLVVACVRFKLHTKVKEFLQRGMTVSIYPTIDVHSNMLLLPTDLATEEIAALLLLYLMLLKEYLVQALQVSKGGESSSGGVDVLQACSITVVPNNVNARDHEFTERFQLASTEFGLLQRVQAILASGSGSDPATTEGMLSCHVDYLKSPISSELSFEGGRSVLRLNTSEVYNNVYYIEPPSD